MKWNGLNESKILLNMIINTTDHNILRIYCMTLDKRIDSDKTLKQSVGERVGGDIKKMGQVSYFEFKQNNYPQSSAIIKLIVIKYWRKKRKGKEKKKKKAQEENTFRFYFGFILSIIFQLFSIRFYFIELYTLLC